MRFGPGKPAYLSPCNGCGICCAEEACAVAVSLIDADPNGRCPALEFEAGRFWCGLVRHPSRYMPAKFRELDDERRGWADEVIGELVAKTLGGVGGSCDSDHAATTVGADAT